MWLSCLIEVCCQHKRIRWLDILLYSDFNLVRLACFTSAKVFEEACNSSVMNELAGVIGHSEILFAIRAEFTFVHRLIGHLLRLGLNGCALVVILWRRADFWNFILGALDYPQLLRETSRSLPISQVISPALLISVPVRILGRSYFNILHVEWWQLVVEVKFTHRHRHFLIILICWYAVAALEEIEHLCEV